MGLSTKSFKNIDLAVIQKPAIGYHDPFYVLAFKGAVGASNLPRQGDDFTDTKGPTACAVHTRNHAAIARPDSVSAVHVGHHLTVASNQAVVRDHDLVPFATTTVPFFTGVVDPRVVVTDPSSAFSAAEGRHICA